MKKLSLLLCAAAFALAGCGGDDESSRATTEAEGTAATGSVPYDQAFIDAMVPHHLAAIEMAKAARDRGLTQPDLQRIARDIISSQQREIDRMLAWREDWFGSRTLGPVLPDVLGVPEGELGMEHGGADEILGAVDVDATFATMMLPHHEGAIAMAEVARERADHDELKELAAAIISAQESEISVLEKHAGSVHHG
ncbi:MAG: DUF305 domain-containing protein [Gaiellaceae bacterium]